MNDSDISPSANPYSPPESDLRKRAPDYDVSTDKLYKAWHVAVAAFIGLALGGFWVISRNARILGHPSDARTLLAVGVAVQVGLILLSFVLPEQISGVVFSIVVATALHHFTRSLQGAAIANHEERGGAFYSAWRAAGAGLFWLLVLVVIVGSLVFAYLTFAPAAADDFIV